MITLYTPPLLKRDDEKHHLSDTHFVKSELLDAISAYYTACNTKLNCNYHMKSSITRRIKLKRMRHTKNYTFFNVNCASKYDMIIPCMQMQKEMEDPVCCVSGLKRSDFEALGKSLIQKLESGEKLERSTRLREI